MRLIGGQQYFLYVFILGLLEYVKLSLENEIFGSYLDVVAIQIIYGIGHKLCIKRCSRFSSSWCKSYSFSRNDFICSIYEGDTSTASLIPGHNVWFGERSNIPANLAGPCASAGCGNKEKCTVLHGQRAKCILNECDDPPNVNHAAVDQGENKVKSNRTYTCSTGYSLSGDAIVFCKANGLWTTPTFSCQQITCGTPPVITGVIYTGTGEVYGSTRTMSCDTGYTASGPTTLTCELSGQWSTPITCSLIECGAPPVINAVLYTGSGETYGSTRTMSCDSGYTASGPTTLTCEVSGQWSTPITCTAVSCGEPPATTGVSYSGTGTTFTSTRTMSCDSGYTASGPTTTTCESNAQWSTIITCTPVSCGEPPATTGVSYSGSGTTFQSTRTMSCDSGYTASGPTTTTCESNAQWSTIITCTPVSCGAPPANTGVSYSGTGTTFQSTRTMSCDSGYTASGPTTTTCESNAQWSTIITCTPVSCGEPSANTGVSYSGSGTTFQSTRTMSCDSGYTASGPTTTTCESNAQWSTIITCTIVSCGDPPVTTGVLYSGTGTTYQSTRTMSCDSGYTASGPTTTTCGSDGQWSTIITCTVAECPDPPTVSGAIVTGSGKSPQSTRTYTCDAGYESSSSAQTITCGSNFQWSTLTLTCTACSSFATTYTQKTNKFFNPPVSFTPSVSGGSVDAAYCKSACTGRSDFVCVAAYYRKNPSGYCVMRPMRVYDDPSYPNYYATNNNYDEYIRDCLIQCVEPTPVAGAIYTGSGNSPGNTRTMSCDAGYEMSGPTTLTCQSNGQWTTAITCTKCTGSSLSSSYTLKSNKYFNPPVSFTPSISGGSVNAAYCQTACTQRSDFVCVAAYYRKSTGGYCILRPMRVYDNPSYPQYYNSDSSWDEYIRNCV